MAARILDAERDLGGRAGPAVRVRRLHQPARRGARAALPRDASSRRTAWTRPTAAVAGLGGRRRLRGGGGAPRDERSDGVHAPAPGTPHPGAARGEGAAVPGRGGAAGAPGAGSPVVDRHRPRACATTSSMWPGVRRRGGDRGDDHARRTRRGGGPTSCWPTRSGCGARAPGRARRPSAEVLRAFAARPAAGGRARPLRPRGAGRARGGGARGAAGGRRPVRARLRLAGRSSAAGSCGSVRTSSSTPGAGWWRMQGSRSATGACWGRRRRWWTRRTPSTTSRRLCGSSRWWPRRWWSARASCSGRGRRCSRAPSSRRGPCWRRGR